MPATLEHAVEVGVHLRAEDAREVAAFGFGPIDAVVESFKNSLWRRAGIVGGQVAAVWGVTGTPMGVVGVPWLMTTPAILDVSPLVFARIYRGEVAEMLRRFPVLENYVDARYLGAVRMLKLAGFHLDAPIPFGAGRAPFCRFEARV